MVSFRYADKIDDYARPFAGPTVRRINVGIQLVI